MESHPKFSAVINSIHRKSICRGVVTQKPHWCVLLGGPTGASVVFSQPLCLRGLDLHLSLLGLGLIHLPPAGPLEEATLGVEEEVVEEEEEGASQRLD